MWLAGVVAPVYAVPPAIADGDTGRASSVAIARKTIVVRACEEVTELVGVEVWARLRTRARELGIVQDVAVMREQSLAKVERGQLLYTREEGIQVTIGGFRCESLALGDSIVDLVVVDLHRLTPCFQVANRWVRPYVGEWNEPLFVR
eukprot:992646-Pleurochrysis_carterae.AAC.1